ncbi:MAG: precorrin-6y C5,15-methyltransferase (decarboxylating) subunit CbiE [Cyanobacteria bacterium P01_A01_bin.135]
MANPAFPIHVVGIGLDGAAGLPEASRQQVVRAEVLVGSDRHQDYFPDHAGQRWTLNGLLTQLQSGNISTQRTVVLASGDPLFFGVGRLLLQHLSPEQLVFHPHLSAVQLAFSRIKQPWQDAQIISVHGRSPERLLTALRQGASTLALLTDNSITPAVVAHLLLSLDLENRYRIWVCEALGSEAEQVQSYSATQLAQRPEHHPLNVVVLQRHPALPSPALLDSALPVVGIDDSQFASFPDRPGLITKKPVRLLALGQLQLRDRQVVWDIGAGTGSVSIEIARLCPHSQVYAIEKSAAGAALIQQNAERFGAANLHLVAGRAPAALGALPEPNRIFIGGSDGDLADLLCIAQARLLAGGILVAALATLDSIAIAVSWLKQRSLDKAKGWHHQFQQVQMTASVPVGPLTRFSPLNPVTLLTLQRQ